MGVKSAVAVMITRCECGKRRVVNAFEHSRDTPLTCVLSVLWSRDGSRICSGGVDNIVRVWEVSSRDCIRTLEGHSAPVVAVSWSRDGSRVCSGGNDDTVRVWELSSGQCVHTTVFEFHFASLEFSLRSFPILSFCLTFRHFCLGEVCCQLA